MKVFVSSDMEGTAGVVDWTQCTPGEPEYEHYRQLLQDEVNAAILGAVDAGADEFLVNDSHGQMRNLRPATLAGRARYLSGRHKPMYMMQGLDASFDAIFFVSYHGSMSSSSPLSHTYNPRAVAEVSLNGTVVGEAGVNALVAAGLGVPIVLVTGDDVTAAETRAIAPGVRTAIVKSAVNRFAADSMHPDDACALIRAEARAAVESLGAASPPAITLPATLDVTFRNADLAEMATWITGVTRTSGVTASMHDDDPVRLFRTFVTVVLLTRAIAE
ncbi:M55 family metallopeptidase [Jatrophihabitans endophyticus]|uniref:M55 family metallopeptidase n=1 Tax=Jatrophihabitans endophyticus TaxID=1206085 RepID=UPI001A10906D|nr:M55 family metallopeptidase [Jatrophihabitans endophyticus]MBE7188504.1 M55 family metallopeptidase [Jatrophihabitans endophyticus]